MADTHGGSGSRYNAGCRCAVCTEAHRVRIGRRREQRRAGRVPVDGRMTATGRILVDGRVVIQDAPEHGRCSTYSNWSCRCAPCTDAWSGYYTQYRHGSNA